MSRLVSWSARRWLLLVLLGALIARLAFLAFFGETLSLQASGYDAYAVNVLSGHGYTRFDDRHADSDLPPLYVFTLVAIYAVLGRSAINVALVQIGVDLLTLTLIYLIGRRAFPARGPAPALLGAAFVAFYPYMLFQDLSANDTAIFVLLLAAGVWGAFRALDSVEPPRRQERPEKRERGLKLLAQDLGAWLKWPAFVGLSFGLAALTKTLVALMVPFLALWWWRRIGLRRAALATLAVGVVLAAVMLPWIARNTPCTASWS